MITELPQNVPSDICLKCDGCCRFASSHSPWRPKVAQDEAGGALAAELDADGALKTVDYNGQPHCAFLCAGDNTCQVYGARPFECRLYPFLLIKSGDGVALGAHLSCPYVQKHRDGTFERHIDEMRTYFQRSDVRAFLKRNPCLAGTYPGAEGKIELLGRVQSER